MKSCPIKTKQVPLQDMVCVCLCVQLYLTLCSHEPWSSRLLCPWDFQGKNTGVGCYFLSRGSSQPGWNTHLLYLLHWQANSLPLSHLGSPGGIQIFIIAGKKKCVRHSVMSDSASPWTIASQSLLSMAFFRQEHWNGQLFPSPGDLPNPGIEPVSPALRADSLLCEPAGKPFIADSPHPQISELTE